MQEGVLGALRNRLTAAATVELASLLSLLQVVQLNEDADERKMLNGKPFSSRAAYASPHDCDNDSDSRLLWSSRVPNKIKIFGWLLHLNRLNTRANLHHKNIIESPHCPRCANRGRES